jgi:hypothetical protein
MSWKESGLRNWIRSYWLAFCRDVKRWNTLCDRCWGLGAYYNSLTGRTLCTYCQRDVSRDYLRIFHENTKE